MPLRDAQLIEAYLEMMLAERGAAANTLAAYSSDMDAFSAYLENRVQSRESRCGCGPVNRSNELS